MNNLNARQLAIVKTLLNVDKTTADHLAYEFGVSAKTIYHDLQILKPVLAESFMTIKVQPRIGISLQGNANNSQLLIKNILQHQPIPDKDQDRITFILTKLLQTDHFFKVSKFSEELFISGKTIERNIKQLSKYLSTYKMHIERQPREGIRLIATEHQKRKMLFLLLNNYWSDYWSADYVNSENSIKYQGMSDNSLLSNQIVHRLIPLVNKFAIKRRINFSDYSFQALVIHLAIVIQRVKTGNLISSNINLSTDVGEQQFKNAKYLANIIQQKFEIKLPNEEISYVQIHLIAAIAGSVNLNLKSDYEEISSPLKTLLADFGFDQELLSGLTIHLQSAIERLKLNATITNPYTKSIKQNYTQAFDRALQIGKYYEKYYGIQMNDDEISYFALYLEAYLERKRMHLQKFNVGLVCSTGLGSAQLLAAKVRKEFPQFNIVGIWSLSDLKQQQLKNVDLIISTIEIKIDGLRTVIVSPLLKNNEIEFIKNAVNQFSINKQHPHEDFLRLIDSRLTIAKAPITNWHQLLKMVGQKLIAYDYADKGVGQSAIQREELSFTSFGDYAVPHAEPTLIKRPVMVVYTMKKPIDWGSSRVSIIFFLAMTKQMTQKEIDLIFDDFYDLVNNKQILGSLIRCDSDEELFKRIRGEISK
ncbi:BglG family transcription antiterminator [Oenococcus sp. UCMA 17063]|nr:BglG family transcription antiterminator [Oenococcus sp. UCMA 17063]